MSGIRVFLAPDFSSSVSLGRYMYDSQRSDMNLKKAFHPYLTLNHIIICLPSSIGKDGCGSTVANFLTKAHIMPEGLAGLQASR